MPQDPQVSPVSLVSRGYQEERETPDSQELDFPDPQELKVSPVFLVSPEPPEDQGDPEWTDCPDSLESLGLRESLASVSLARLVCLASLERRVCLGQRVTLASLEALEVPEEMDLMVALGLKENLVCLVFLELVAHLDPLPLGRLESQAPLELLDRWDRQDTPEQTEPRATLVLQAWISLVCPETEGPPASMELQDQSDHQDLPEGQGGMACLVCQELKETWAQSDPRDQAEALEDLEVLVALDLKVSLGSQAETVFQEVQELKEREETLVFKDLQD